MAYNAATGQRLWVKRYSGSGSHNDRAYDIGVSSGGVVLVTDASATVNLQGDYDYATVAYSSTGTQLWVKRYRGLRIEGGDDVASTIAVSPDGTTAYISGDSAGSSGCTTVNCSSFATIAYRVSDGATIWTKRLKGAGATNDSDGSLIAAKLAISDDGSRIFVEGSVQIAGGWDYQVVAYASTGTKLWTARWNAKSEDLPRSIALSPDGSQVIITGQTGTLGFTDKDYATVSFNASTGTRLWVSRYDGLAAETRDVAVSLTTISNLAVVTGFSAGTHNDTDYATVAYTLTS